MATEFGPGRFTTTCYAEDTTKFASDEEEPLIRGAERPCGLVIRLEKLIILATDVQQLPYAKMECNCTKSKENKAKAEHCTLEDAS